MLKLQVAKNNHLDGLFLYLLSVRPPEATHLGCLTSQTLRQFSSFYPIVYTEYFIP